MSKRLSLLLAAAVMAFTFQAYAADDFDDDADDDDIVMQERGFYGPRGHRWNDDGPRGRMGPGPRHHGDWDGPRPGKFDGRGPRHMRGHMGGMHMGKGLLGPRFAEMLQLTDAQKSKLVDLMTENYREGLLARMEMHDAAGKLRDLYDADAPSADAVVEANQEMGAAKGKLDALRLKMWNDVKSVLTPEQIQKLDDFEKSAPPRPDRRPGEKRPPAPGKGPRP